MFIIDDIHFSLLQKKELKYIKDKTYLNLCKAKDFYKKDEHLSEEDAEDKAVRYMFEVGAW